jgi:hypothetical protein
LKITFDDDRGDQERAIDACVARITNSLRCSM